jgi:hypothetical protein
MGHHDRHRTVILALVATLAACQRPTTPNATLVATPRIAEAACGQCQFGLPGSGCDLAVRIDGRAYFVDGTGIDDYGDAHAADGFCNAIRRARVTGEIIDGRFAAQTLELLADGNR